MSGFVLPHTSGQRDGVSRAKLEMRVAIELDELEQRAQQFGRGLGFGHSLFGAAMRAGFAFRTDDQVNAAASAGLQGHDGTAAELDIVRMGTEDQERSRFRVGGRCRLHLLARSSLGVQS